MIAYNSCKNQRYLSLPQLSQMANDKSSVKEYLKLMTSALVLGKEGDAAALNALKPHAVAAVSDFIRHPAIYQADFADTPAIRQLANDKALAPLHALFVAMLSGNMAQFKAAATQAALEQAGVSADLALHKARMVALLTVCSSCVHEEVRPSHNALQVLARYSSSVSLLWLWSSGVEN